MVSLSRQLVPAAAACSSASSSSTPPAAWTPLPGGAAFAAHLKSAGFEHGVLLYPGHGTVDGSAVRAYCWRHR